jgi:hypothetical protein
MANRKSSVSDWYGKPFSLAPRKDEIEGLIEAIEGAAAILKAGAWQANDKILGVNGAAEIMLASEAVLSAGLESFKRHINVEMLREVNGRDAEAGRKPYGLLPREEQLQAA